MAAMTTSYISSIPLQLGPSRSRDSHRQSQRSNGNSNGIRRTISNTANASGWEDITKERPGDEREQGDMLQMPEDHLEDLLSLPISQELRPRKTRSRTSMASDNSTSTTAFPTTSTPKKSITPSDGTLHLSPSPDDSLATVANSTSSPYRPPKRSDSLRKRTQSSPLQNSPNTRATSTTKPLSPEGSSSSSTNKKAKRTVGSSPSPAASPTLGQSQPRSRAVTGNAATPSKKQATTNSTARRPLQSSTATTNRQASNPPRKNTISSTANRPRSHSASVLSDPALAEYDADSKPPWLEKPSYLYKSDIEAPAPGSLAHIAQQAQKRMNGPNISLGQEGSDDAAGNTSTRSWDDVILPAVAKQIREKQMLEAQQKAVMYGGSSELEKEDNTAAASGDDQLQKAENAQEPSGQQQEEEEQNGYRQSHEQAPTVPPKASTPTYADTPVQQSPQQYTMYLSTRTASAQQIGTASHHSSSSVSQSSNHLTGRQEIWQQSSLSSPTTARHNGFGAAQHRQQPFRLAQGEIPAGAVFDKEQADLQKREREKERMAAKQDDTHSKGCRCVIM